MQATQSLTEEKLCLLLKHILSLNAQYQKLILISLFLNERFTP